ncbi:MAG: DUF4783 domain-containing protein [Bacteroidetes bacterium]|nr:DUF4783 domain-containing protein [Bacteroidota bacterium]
MKLIKSLILVVLVVFTGMVKADDGVLGQISLALKNGNSKELAKMFDSNVELKILDQDGAYSATQAEQVLKDFFTKNPSQGFELIHKGSSNEGSQYGIGNLTTSSGVYRTYFYIKQKSGHYKIQELRIEQE